MDGNAKPAVDAAALCEKAHVSRQGKELLRPRATPPEFLKALVAAGRHDDAILFAGQALPPRDAVWWGSLCLWKASERTPPPPDKEALGAAVRWVAEPKPEAAKAADRARTLAASDAARWLAQAAASGEADPAAGGYVSAAVFYATDRPDPDATADLRRHCADLALQAAGGACPLPQPKAAAPRR